MPNELEDNNDPELEQDDKPVVETKPADTEKPAGSVVTMPTSAIGKMKKEERERGQKAAMAEMDKIARAMGYKNHADLLEAAKVAKGKTKPAAQPSVDDQDRDSDPELEEPGTEVTSKTNPELLEAKRELRKMQRTVQQQQQERVRLNKQLNALQMRAKRAEHEAAAQAAELDLRIAATKAGVTDPDFALHLLKSSLKGKTPKDLENFSSSEFFTGLKRERPHLFEPSVEPANAGQSGESNIPANKTVTKAPSTVRAGAPAGGEPKASKDGSFDAMTATPEQVRARLKQHGVTV